MAISNANEVADALIAFCNEHGDVMTNLRLQKLLYYSQAWYLALYDKPLFDEPFEAWVRGPVQPDVWKRFKEFQWMPIGIPVDDTGIPEDVKRHVADVMSAYGKFSAFDLERMTHAESPWIDARGSLATDLPSRAVISQESMKEYYKKRLSGKEEQN
jgi:uncharacterized phage-associated protein